MKSVSIHPVSATAGAGLLGLVLLAAAAAQTPVTLQQIPTGQPGPLRVAGIPDPRHMVVIREGTQYVVPPGKILAITALGSTANSVVVDLLIDGQREVQSVASIPAGGPATVGALPVGLTVQAGATVEAVTGSIYGRAWGYLVDA